MRSSEDPAHALARRLRELREEAGITQARLAEVLGDQPRTVSAALISSWENAHAVPPTNRLHAYATYFAASGSTQSAASALPADAELTAAEQALRDELARELTDLRAVQLAAGHPAGPDAAHSLGHLGGPWAFPDDKPVTIVCAELPESQRRDLPRPGDPDRPYAKLYEYADLDALFELHGHIRAANPTSLVRVRKASALRGDHYTTHLVVLGGVDWNLATEKLLHILDLPVTQHAGSLGNAYFEVRGDGEPQRFTAQLAPDGSVVTDVGHFFRAPNPFNQKRTITICNAMSSLGVLGTVRALTDERFRDRNGDHLAGWLARDPSVSILMRVRVIGEDVITPDWTRSSTRLHEWSGEVG